MDYPIYAMGEIKSIPDIIKEVSPYYKKKGSPEVTHTLVYDSSSETLEPVYFFILDLMSNLGMSPEKLVDNFSSTPGSGHFAELGQRATVMQQQAGKIMGDVNTVLRSVLNIVYDLKEFKIRLSHYESLNSKNKAEQEGAMLALKQIWMDKVDINKGNSSIKAMTFGQSGFQTLMDAFLVAKDENLKGNDGKEIDLNDRVKRIVKSRIIEFNIWLKESEKELKKRYELEKTYLKSQVNSLKLYARWVRPYLKAAQELESKESNNPALVKTFNTIILELTLLGKNKLDVADEAAKGSVPADFAKDKFLGNRRKYHSCVLVSFTFRGIPQRISQQSHYAFGGKAEITFSAYALNDDELKKFSDTMKQSEINDVLNLIEGATTESLKNLEEDINSFLDEKPKEEKKKEKKNLFSGLAGDDSNPFVALFGDLNLKKLFKKSEPKEEKKKENAEINPDDWVEINFFRQLAIETAKTNAMTLFDTYKKSHGMESFT